jgi:hypothetical protein
MTSGRHRRPDASSPCRPNNIRNDRHRGQQHWYGSILATRSTRDSCEKKGYCDPHNKKASKCGNCGRETKRRLLITQIPNTLPGQVWIVPYPLIFAPFCTLAIAVSCHLRPTAITTTNIDCSITIDSITKHHHGQLAVDRRRECWQRRRRRE